jgi:cytochrome c oxidase subunit 2
MMPRWSTVAATLILASGLIACGGSYPQSTLHPRSDFGAELTDLYMQIFWWAVVVFVVVEALLVYVLIRFRARPGQDERPKPIHGHTALEIAWTIAPAVILVFIAVPTIQTIFRTSQPPPADAVAVEVIGHQWWWEYRYPEYGIVTANEMHVPKGRAVALAMTSADVIHSFWVPRLAGKRDVILGRTTRLMFTADSAGVYLGQCAEYCGTSHGNMGLRVVVDEPAAFDAWVSQQQTTPVSPDSSAELLQRGLAAFTTIRDPASNSCLACHAIDGVSFGVLGPNLTHVASRSTIAAGMLPNSEAGLRRWLRNAPGEKPGSLMPAIDLTNEELDGLIAYLRSLR